MQRVHIDLYNTITETFRISKTIFNRIYACYSAINKLNLGLTWMISVLQDYISLVQFFPDGLFVLWGVREKLYSTIYCQIYFDVWRTWKESISFTFIQNIIHFVRSHQWRIQHFPEVGTPTLRGGSNIRFWENFPKTAWNWKNLDRRGASLAPP